MTDLTCWNAYNANCLARQLLSRIADKWTILIVGALSNGPVRFGEIHRKVDGISKKVLTDTLRSLEGDGLLFRTVHPSSPPAVEYGLTDLGRSFINTALGVKQWVEAHVTEVEEARGQKLIG